MAAVTSATDVASFPELINSEAIWPAVIEAAREQATFLFVAGMYDITGGRTNQLAVPQFEAAGTPAGVHTETDEYAATEQTAAEVTITVDSVGQRAAVSTEVIDSTTIDTVREVTRQLLLDIAERQDTDFWSNITSAGNQSDNSGFALDLEVWGSTQATFWAQKPPGSGQAFFVGHDDQINRDLRAALRGSGASFVVGDSEIAAVIKSGGRSPFVGSLDGIQLINTDNTPAFDGSNWSGAFGMANEGGALAHVYKRKTNVKTMANERVAVAMDGDVVRDHIDIVATTRYGDGIITNDNLLEVATRT